MKGRPFLAGLLVIAVLALGLGWGGWWLLWERGPLHWQHHALAIPRAARFVPRQAPLSLYIFSDGEQPVDYARAVAPLRQRDAATSAVERLRDGAFAAAGLDYHDELAGWLAPELGLSLFDTPGSESGSGWLLVLSSKDGEGARRFLQRFWQSRSLAGSDLQVSQYRGMGLISGRGALVGRDPVPLATALVEDDLVLIASGRTTLERALDVSQIEDLNEAGLRPLQEAIGQLGEGVALVVARSGALTPWLGLPVPEGQQAPGSPLLVGALQPEGRRLALNGQLRLPAVPSPPPSDPSGFQGEVQESEPTEAALLKELGGDSDNLAIVRDPAGLLRQPWLTPLVRRITTPPQGGPLPPLLAEADQGVLLVSQSPEGWLMGTGPRSPRPDALEAALAAEGLIAAPLEVGGDTITVWTRLLASAGRGGRSGGKDQLLASVAGWRQEKGPAAWWGRELSLLNARPTGRNLAARQQQLAQLGLPEAPLRWVVGRDTATALMQHWKPWNLLTSVAGGPLAPGVESLSLAIDPGDTMVRWRAHLKLAEAPNG